MFNEMKKDPRVAAKDLGFINASISAQESSICKTLNRHGIRGRAPGMQGAYLYIALQTKHCSMPNVYQRPLHNTNGKKFCGQM